MHVGQIYAITALVCMLQIILILNRTRTTEYKETIDTHLCDMLYFFAAFCFVDALWGLCYSQSFFISSSGFMIVSYGYQSMAALSAFVGIGYGVYYLSPPEKEKKVINCIRFILLGTQFIILLSNIWNHEAFYVDNQGNYFMGSLRIYMYSLQFSYYVLFILYGLIKLYRGVEDRTKVKTVISFSLVPLLFGIGQYAFYDVAMYSMGFLLSAFVIYSYNVTAQREDFLKERANRLMHDVYIDALTGLHNRRAYEDDLIKLQMGEIPQNLVYISIDVNSLKVINDSMGHEAGDELLRGAVFCMSTCLGSYGKIYRTGGDEFISIIYAGEEQLDQILADFEKTVDAWSGESVKELSVAYGLVTRAEAMGKTLMEIANEADKRMYHNKAQYYAKKGIDRRGQQEAYDAICKSYTKILKINLSRDTYSIIEMDLSERDVKKGFDDSFSNWVRKFVETGQVHPEDQDFFVSHTNIDYLRQFFKQGNMAFCIYYKRIIGNTYKKAMLEIIPAREYADEEQIVFLYVKNIDRK